MSRACGRPTRAHRRAAADGPVIEGEFERLDEKADRAAAAMMETAAVSRSRGIRVAGGRATC